MANKLHIAAFSIVEALVGMAVTAIVIGLVFVVFTILSSQLATLKTQHQVVSDLNRLCYSLRKDIHESQIMVPQHDGVRFVTYSGESVVFTKESDYLLRKTAVFIDTFRIHVNQFQADTLSNEKKSLMFQRLRFNVNIHDKRDTLAFYKAVYANELLKINIK